MRFFCIYNRTKTKYHISLRTHEKNNSPILFLRSFFLGIFNYLNPRQLNNNTHECRRTSSGTTHIHNISSIAGSMTVEAAMVVPLFIFCLLNLMFGIQVMETSSRITAAMNETGNEICSYGYALENGIGEGIPSGLFTTAYAMGKISERLGKVADSRGGIKGGRAGLSYLGTEIMNGNGIVKIVIEYSLKFPVEMGIRPYRLGMTYYGHAWVGYDVGGSELENIIDDPIVYVTPSGSVYHTDINCVHLNPSVSMMSADDAYTKKNNDGEYYTACNMCGGGIGAGNVYVTSYGNKYHSTIQCPGIKRTIMSIHLSEVGGKRVCMTCG